MSANSPTDSSPAGRSRALPIPLTFTGVVAFSRRPPAWLLSLWLVTALGSAAMLIWFVETRWIPVVEDTIQGLPEGLILTEGSLESFSQNESIRQSNRFLSLVVTSSSSTPESSTADVQVILTPHEARLHSLLGYLQLPYDHRLALNLSPSHLVPWWNSRKPLVRAAAFLVLVGNLLLAWMLLASLYAPPLFLVIYMSDRRAEFAKTWRLAGTALFPGALIMVLSIGLYTWHLMSLLGLLVATAIHFLLPWIYLMGSAPHLPGVEGRLGQKENPFASSLPDANESRKTLED